MVVNTKTDKENEDSKYESVGNKVCSAKKLPQDEIPRSSETAWPRAEMAEELHMMQCPPSRCHGSVESSINTAALTISHHLICTSPAHALKEAETPARCLLRGETCLLALSTSETDRQGEEKQLWSSVAQRAALRDPGCPPNAPDAYPFHAINLCVTNSHRSANGNG